VGLAGALHALHRRLGVLHRGVPAHVQGLIYGSYRKPRELVWIFGCAIFLTLMAEAFMGYLLPWGQMSYWGAQVIVNLFSAIPFIGPDLALLIRGDYVVSDATLNRFFSFHVIAVPLVLLGLVVAHLLALHDVGSNNPDGVEIKGPNAPKDANGKPLDGIPFHPYYTVHDLMGVAVFLMVFSAVIFFAPEAGGYFLEYNNFIPADPLKTPRTSRRSGTSRRTTRCCAPSPAKWHVLVIIVLVPRSSAPAPPGS
jgi:ubiquinol-cytochrome c reductase cytochrome b subunit